MDVTFLPNHTSCSGRKDAVVTSNLLYQFVVCFLEAQGERTGSEPDPRVLSGAAPDLLPAQRAWVTMQEKASWGKAYLRDVRRMLSRCLLLFGEPLAQIVNPCLYPASYTRAQFHVAQPGVSPRVGNTHGIDPTKRPSLCTNVCRGGCGVLARCAQSTWFLPVSASPWHTVFRVFQSTTSKKFWSFLITFSTTPPRCGGRAIPAGRNPPRQSPVGAFCGDCRPRTGCEGTREPSVRTAALALICFSDRFAT